ncbi:MAG: hypothetical protein HOO19_16690 [Rhodospirillaceae bacterium]|nr:hypothetical protein [Rhodospirillaceae bacterium]MBT4750975.1 hypothetical protein [Rhodospirillaceae bacterium]MBT7234760.1 hypothetical protein [Rhodospirillaceae bacterium]
MNKRNLPEKSIRTAFRRLAILIGVGLAFWVSPASASPARDLVEKFHDNLIAVMKKADSISIEQRFEILDPAVRRTFNMPEMIRIASGSVWRTGVDGDKSAAVAAFTKMSVSTYASRFDGFSGQRFETVSETPGPKNSVVVRTRIHRPGDTPVKLTYILRQYSGQWRAFDVIVAGGISELALRHSEYRAILKKGGLGALAAILNKKSDQILGR